MLIDSHCHLDYYSEAELPDVLARAAAAGVAEMVTIGTTLAQSDRILALTSSGPAKAGHPRLHGATEDVDGRPSPATTGDARPTVVAPKVWCCVGVHPHHAAEAPVPDPEAIAARTAHPKVVGIGESGLDYFYDKAPRDVQQASFRAHIRASRLAGLPIAIHARDADGDILRILQEEREGGWFDFLLHCFSSGRALAEEAVAIGGHVSFSGILTFPKSHELRAIAHDLPADRLLVETDAPYLAPVPHRGRRNEPAWVADTARVLAEVRGMSPDALGELTTANFRRLFRKAA